AALFAWGGEALRVVERPMELGFLKIPGVPGMRMVIFSIILMLVIIFARRGIMGRNEFSWDWLLAKLRLGERG
ncbi:MAG: branched-chain amino acid ABC transporter permease, partial [Desulforhabdus sp.]|nr:branched-chain amino acid ABC transporter permease [Desulforhabdus sp.]